jgi:hypothetical protein
MDLIKPLPQKKDMDFLCIFANNTEASPDAAEYQAIKPQAP